VDAARDRRRGLAAPFLLVNPRSGDESPSADELAARAKELGIDVHMLRRDDDATTLARDAAERGAEALGIAGGDGSLAAVAEAALDADVPFVAVPFGTRNHFARDAGFDIEDPVGALAAFQGEERRVDVGCVCGRLFLNNVSLGVYAQLVHDPAHETKNRLVAAARMIPAAIGVSRRPLDLAFDLEGERVHHRALVLLVANGGYELSPGGFGRRERLDEGRLHAYVVRAGGRGTILGLLWRAMFDRIEQAPNWAEHAAPSFTVESKHGRLHAAIDGEPVVLEAPLDFEVRPRALRALVPPGSRDGGSEA
jgi:diacylglycerol kinase family enzyme